MSVHVLLNSLKKLRKEIKFEACRVLSLFRNEFNKFNNTGARFLYSIYLMTLNFFCNNNFGVKK